jgi:hypothetical protein
VGGERAEVDLPAVVGLDAGPSFVRGRLIVTLGTVGKNGGTVLGNSSSAATPSASASDRRMSLSQLRLAVAVTRSS